MTIKTCVCDNPWQDARYGLKKRVANPTEKTGAPGFRCTACGKDIVVMSKPKVKKVEPKKKKG